MINLFCLNECELIRYRAARELAAIEEILQKDKG